MRITVDVIAGARIEKIEEISKTHLKIKTQKPPEKDRANKDIIQKIADHYKVNKKNIRFISGQAKRKKIIEIIT